MAGDNKFFGKVFGKKDNLEKEKGEKMKKIDSFFKTKMIEFSCIDDIKNSMYLKPYARGFNDVDFGEALRKLQYGDREEALNILNQMIKKAIQIDPTWPDIKEMESIRSFIEEATNDDLSKVEGIKTSLN
jgi:hypothetical protein